MSLLTLTEAVATQSAPESNVERAIPVSPSTDWVTLRAAATVNAADNSGNTILDPNTSITTSSKLRVGSAGTGVLIRLNYLSSALTTAPVIQVFGFDQNGVPMRLYDATGSHELTLAADATNDIDDSVNAYTVHKQLDAKGCKWIVVGVKTAGAGGAAATAVIQGRVI